MVRTKICGFTRPEDARTAAELGVDAIGLVFYDKSQRAVNIQQAQAIVQALPPFVSVVGLFVNESAERINDILAQVPIDIIQFHGDETPEFCRGFRRPYIKAVRVQDTAGITAAIEQFADARAVLFDAYVDGEYGGTGHRFDWQMLPETLSGHWVLSGGLTPDNTAAAIALTAATAIDVSSGVESTPGIKCPQKMAAFLQAARAAK